MVEGLANGVDPEFLKVFGKRRIVQIAQLLAGHVRKFLIIQTLDRTHIHCRKFVFNLSGFRHFWNVIRMDGIAVETFIV